VSPGTISDDDWWFLEGISMTLKAPEPLRKLCVAWQYTIIEDNLYLNSGDYDENGLLSLGFAWNSFDEEKYRRIAQNGSRALYFSHCRNENALWLPLLEKAYAKVHGGYGGIRGGVAE